MRIFEQIWNGSRTEFWCLKVIAADRREAAHYSCDTRAQISMPSYV